MSVDFDVRGQQEFAFFTAEMLWIMDTVLWLKLWFNLKNALMDLLQTHSFLLHTEPILPICRIRTLRRAPETTGGPLALKDVSFLILASGSENMNDRFF